MVAQGGSALGPVRRIFDFNDIFSRSMRMKELIEYIAQSLTANPEAVRVTESDEGDQIVIRLEVAPEDKGKIIGRQGRVAQAMRVLLRVAAVKDGTRAMLEIV